MLKQWKKIKILLIIMLSAIFLYSSINIGRYLYDGYVNKKLNENLSEAYHSDGNMADGTDRYKDLLLINEDVVGWIEIPDTQIDYPVVQTDNNQFYLTHNIKNERSSHGSIFMDYRNYNDDRDYNTVLYGHNMKDDSMFGDLSAYKDRAFYDGHAYIEYGSLAGTSKWEIFSVYICGLGDSDIRITFHDGDEYVVYLDAIIDRSIYETNIEVTKDDRILTLVTCSYEYDDARLVIHAKKVDSSTGSVNQ